MSTPSHSNTANLTAAAALEGAASETEISHPKSLAPSEIAASPLQTTPPLGFTSAPAAESEEAKPLGNMVGKRFLGFRIPFDHVNWETSSFLIGTLLLTLTAVPWYIWKFGCDAFQTGLFFFLFAATAMSITLGYHRLFSHRAFKAHWSVRLFTLLFGAATFENSALMWSSEHRRHHKHVDHDEDPYDISKGFFWAHIGWLLFKMEPQPPFDNVNDLKKDRMVMLQHKYIHQTAVLVGLIFPAILGGIWNGWIGALGGFLIPGVARVVAVQHCTFFINSLCHTIGNRPYSSRCSARDSWIMAIFTFGEGYHNYHHEFQHDYRNGIRWWHYDPTKWAIWIMSKLGLTEDLRRVPEEKIQAAVERENALKQGKA